MNKNQSSTSTTQTPIIASPGHRAENVTLEISMKISGLRITKTATIEFDSDSKATMDSSMHYKVMSLCRTESKGLEALIIRHFYKDAGYLTENTG